MYRPLPDNLTIRDSGIEGLGLFAKEDIGAYEIFGVSHIIYDDRIDRTPLGGFYNHSEDPNCAKRLAGGKYWLYSIREIKEGEELTVKYTLYDIEK